MHRTIDLPTVLYGFETWSVTLREERRVKVLENRMVRGIFGPKRDDVIEEWGKLHKEEISDLYSSPNIIQLIESRKLRWVKNIACMGKERCMQDFGGEN